MSLRGSHTQEANNNFIANNFHNNLAVTNTVDAQTRDISCTRTNTKVRLS